MFMIQIYRSSTTREDGSKNTEVKYKYLSIEIYANTGQSIN